MKLVCDCGNEVVFNNINKHTGKPYEINEYEGQYITIDDEKFSTWGGEHDKVGFTCESCKKSMWFFT